jgi:hypothetical protein
MGALAAAVVVPIAVGALALAVVFFLIPFGVFSSEEVLASSGSTGALAAAVVVPIAVGALALAVVLVAFCFVFLGVCAFDSVAFPFVTVFSLAFFSLRFAILCALEDIDAEFNMIWKVFVLGFDILRFPDL